MPSLPALRPSSYLPSLRVTAPLATSKLSSPLPLSPLPSCGPLTLLQRVIGGIVLVHFVLGITGLMMVASAVHTHHLREAVDPALSSKERVAVMARIWREERNFWISVLTYLLWGCLYRFYGLLMEHGRMEDRFAALKEELRVTKAFMAAEGAPPKKPEVPSAPPAGAPASAPAPSAKPASAPEAADASDSLRQRAGKGAAGKTASK
jgi:hypothetical protein